VSRADSEFFEDARPSVGAPVPPRPPARARSRPARLGILVVVLAAAVGGGVADRLIGRPAPAPAPAVPVSSVAPASDESSVWYCAGGTPAPGSAAEANLQLVNTTTRPVTAVVSALSDTGVRRSVPVRIPPDAQVTEVPGDVVAGHFVAASVAVEGGGVLVTESVASAQGWSEAPCSRSTASTWYFASGSTVNGGTLAVALYNPTSTEAVVDMTFVTPSGIAEPQPFEGIVVAPESLAVEEVDRYVQDARSVSTIVSARTGAVVATALQTVSYAGSHGLSLRLGSPELFRAWSVPRSIDLTGGLTAISIFNPTGRSEKVTVTVRPYRSPPARFTEVVGPTMAWVLETTAETRIPDGIPFTATVSSGAGAGVVVDRSIVAPSSFGVPQFGAVTALALSPGVPSAGVLSAPGTQARPALPGAALASLDLVNPGRHGLRATLFALEGQSGAVRVGSVAVGPGEVVTVGTSASIGVRPLPAIGRLGRVPLVVGAGGPLLVLEDLLPGATAGVVSLPAAGSTGP
jgi:hypothetical protein